MDVVVVFDVHGHFARRSKALLAIIFPFLFGYAAAIWSGRAKNRGATSSVLDYDLEKNPTRWSALLELAQAISQRPRCQRLRLSLAFDDRKGHSTPMPVQHIWCSRSKLHQSNF